MSSSFFNFLDSLSDMVVKVTVTPRKVSQTLAFMGTMKQTNSAFETGQWWPRGLRRQYVCLRSAVRIPAGEDFYPSNYSRDSNV